MRIMGTSCYARWSRMTNSAVVYGTPLADKGRPVTMDRPSRVRAPKSPGTPLEIHELS